MTAAQARAIAAGLGLDIEIASIVADAPSLPPDKATQLRCILGDALREGMDHATG